MTYMTRREPKYKRNATQPSNSSLFDGLVDGLRKKDEDANARSVFYLTRLGAQVVPKLVDAIVFKVTHVEHRIRLLEIIERIGEPLSLESWQQLYLVAVKSSSEKLRGHIMATLSQLKPTQR